MTQQHIQWPNREQHPSVRVNDPDTCQEPSEFRMSKGRMAALAGHVQRPDGLTDFELADLIGSQQTSAGVRRKELERAGLVVATTNRRPSPSGKPVIVWRITEQGVALMRHLNDMEAAR